MCYIGGAGLGNYISSVSLYRVMNHSLFLIHLGGPICYISMKIVQIGHDFAVIMMIKSNNIMHNFPRLRGDRNAEEGNFACHCLTWRRHNI